MPPILMNTKVIIKQSDHSKKINNLNYKKNGKQVNKNFIYRSDLNNKWMDVLSLKKIIKKKFDL